MKRKAYTGEIAQNVDLPIDLVQAVDAFCENRILKKKNVFELALRRFLATEAGRGGK